MEVGKKWECRIHCAMKMIQRHELGGDGVNNCDHGPSRKVILRALEMR